MLFSIEKWVFTRHAYQRMLERNVSENEIAQIIRQNEVIIMQGEKFILANRFDSRSDNMIAIVMLSGFRDEWIILTVMINFKVNS